jgi:hypothetical protein
MRAIALPSRRGTVRMGVGRVRWRGRIGVVSGGGREGGRGKEAVG